MKYFANNPAKKLTVEMNNSFSVFAADLAAEQKERNIPKKNRAYPGKVLTNEQMAPLVQAILSVK